MKKLIVAMMMALCLIVTSCKDGQSTYVPGYEVTITGVADGDVDVAFPDGTIKVNGATELAFNYGNIIGGVEVVAFADALQSSDPNVKAFAEAKDKEFSVNSASGKYKITIEALFIEPITGIKIPYSRTFTNME